MLKRGGFGSLEKLRIDHEGFDSFWLFPEIVEACKGRGVELDICYIGEIEA